MTGIETIKVKERVHSPRIKQAKMTAATAHSILQSDILQSYCDISQEEIDAIYADTSIAAFVIKMTSGTLRNPIFVKLGYSADCVDTIGNPFAAAISEQASVKRTWVFKKDSAI